MKTERLNSILFRQLCIHRESLWTSVGFRHIHGVKTWDSYSKARYIAEVTEKYGVPLTEIAQRIGDRHATVKRLYRGYKILEQAESQSGFDERISLGIDSTSRTCTQQPINLISNGFSVSIQKTSCVSTRYQKKDSLNWQDLMTWLYGQRSKGIEPIVRTQNPDLNTLRTVISKPEALDALRSGHSLKRSLRSRSATGVVSVNL